MSHVERCPVCQGVGKIYTGIYASAGTQQKTCHGCSGTGWVTVWDITDQPAPWTCGETNKNAPATVDWKASYPRACGGVDGRKEEKWLKN